jgi:ParB family chromosome partitioning protein
MAGLEEVPAYIRVANDQTMLEMALVENIQREDLNAIEVAFSYQRLLDECKLTQEELAGKIAKSRTSITNHLRLLKLPPVIQLAVREKELSMGHARALVSAGEEEKQLALFNQTIEEQLSVRELEQLIRDGVKEKQTSKKNIAKTNETLTREEKSFINEMSEKVAAKVQITKLPKGNGKLVINFNSDVDLNRIIEILNK